MIRAIAWDFDGVLNRNVVDGHFIWADNLQADLGIDPAFFRDTFFGPDFDDVIQGQRDFLDVVGAWCAAHVPALDPVAFKDYWFAKDAHPDSETLAIVKALPDLTHVIATNNEAHRARYIMEDMGFAAHVSAMYAAGPMKVAKPDPGYFNHVQAGLGLAAEEILLVDDHAPNIAAAKGLGWQTHHFGWMGHDALRSRLLG